MKNLKTKERKVFEKLRTPQIVLDTDKALLFLPEQGDYLSPVFHQGEF